MRVLVDEGPQRVNELILEKALTLSLRHFEDSEFYDKLTRARREASSRPLSLVNRTFRLVENAISLVAFGGLLLQFSGWAVLVLALAGLPAFIAELLPTRGFAWADFAPPSEDRCQLALAVPEGFLESSLGCGRC